MSSYIFSGRQMNFLITALCWSLTLNVDLIWVFSYQRSVTPSLKEGCTSARWVITLVSWWLPQGHSPVVGCISWSSPLQRYWYTLSSLYQTAANYLTIKIRTVWKTNPKMLFIFNFYSDLGPAPFDLDPALPLMEGFPHQKFPQKFSQWIADTCKQNKEGESEVCCGRGKWLITAPSLHIRKELIQSNEPTLPF